jgi:hypothetical protein
MVKELLVVPGEGGKSRIGWNVRRKDASELRCLTVKDIFEVLDNSVKATREERLPGNLLGYFENAVDLALEYSLARTSSLNTKPSVRGAHP